MADFERQLEARAELIGGEIMDVLLSLADFSEFKLLMLSHKTAQTTGNALECSYNSLMYANAFPH